MEVQEAKSRCLSLEQNLLRLVHVLKENIKKTPKPKLQTIHLSIQDIHRYDHVYYSITHTLCVQVYSHKLPLKKKRERLEHGAGIGGWLVGGGEETEMQLVSSLYVCEEE